MKRFANALCVLLCVLLLIPTAVPAVYGVQIPEFSLSYVQDGQHLQVTVALDAGGFHSMNLAFSVSDGVKCTSIQRSDLLREFNAQDANGGASVVFNKDTAEIAMASYNKYESAGALFNVVFSLPERSVSSIALQIPVCAVTEGDTVTEIVPIITNGVITIDTSIQEHQYTAETTPATCEIDGRILYTCIVCGDTYSEKIPAAGHKYGEWITVSEATTAAPGQKICECTVCGAKQTEMIPQLEKIAVTVFSETVTYKGTKRLKTQIKNPENVGYTVSYKSADPSIASVDGIGNVTGEKRGKTQITCTVKDAYGSVSVSTATVEVKFTWFQWLIYLLFFGWAFGF